MLQIILVIGSFLVSCTGPGLLLLRRTTVAPSTRLLFSICISLALIYLASFAFYIADFSVNAYFVFLLFSATACLICWRDLLAIVRDPTAGAIVRSWALFVGWLLILVLNIRSFSGGNWAGDWYEQYARTRFFVEHWPLDFKFHEGLFLPARSPLFNLVCAYFLALHGVAFATYQIVTALVASLALIPTLLLVKRVADTRVMSLCAALIALNPMILQHSTWGWARPLTSFFILAAIWTFLEAESLRHFAPHLIVVTLLSLAILTHYSAAPFAIVFAVIYLARVVSKRGHSFAALVAQGVVTVAIFATWISWAITHYGAHVTFGGSNAVQSFTGIGISEAIRIVIFDFTHTALPLFIFHDLGSAIPDEPAVFQMRDLALLIYQNNLFFICGSFSAIIILWRYFHRQIQDAEKLKFWFLFVLAVVAISSSTFANRALFGFAHHCLLPLAFFGVSYLSVSGASLPLWLRRCWWVALGVDSIFGVFLHYIARGVAVPDINLRLKNEHRTIFIGDLVPQIPVQIAMTAALLLLLASAYLLLAASKREPKIR